MKRGRALAAVASLVSLACASPPAPTVAPELGPPTPLPSGRVELREASAWLDVAASEDESYAATRWFDVYPRLLPFASPEAASQAIAEQAVFDAITLPAIAVADEWTAPGPFLAVLSVHCADERVDHLCLDLVVRGRRLALGFGEEQRAAPLFGFALTADAVTITPTTIAELPAWRVRVDLPIVWRPSPQCWMGQLVLFVDDERYDDPRTVVSRSYLEFGKCE